MNNYPTKNLFHPNLESNHIWLILPWARRNLYKYSFTIYVCCAICACSFGQSSQIDSLINLLSVEDNSPSEKLFIHHELSELLLVTDPAKSQHHIDTGLALIEDDGVIHAEVNYIDFLIHQCIIFYNEGDYQGSKAINDKIERNINDALDKPYAQVWVLEKKSKYALLERNHRDAKAHLIQALKISKEYDRDHLEGLMHNRLGKYYEKYTHRVDSVLYHITAGAKFTEEDNVPNQLIDHMNLANVHFDIGRDSLAIDFLIQGLNQYDETSAKYLLAEVSYLLSKIYGLNDNLEEAEYYLDHALGYLSGIKSEEDIYHKCQHQRGVLLWQAGDVDDAIRSYERALAYFQEVNSQEWISICRISLIQAWMKRNKANARAYYDTILMSSPYDMTSFRDKRQYLKILSQSAVELDDYKQSYELENYLVDMVEKRNSIEEELYIMKYKERYQNEIGSRTRKYEIASLKAQKSRLAKLYVVGGAALLLLMSIPVVSINSIKQKKFQMAVSARSKQLSEINQQLESKREELERFAFITAHDLKSPILSILGFSHLLDKEVSVLSNPRLKEYIEFIISSGQQMKNLIQGVLEFAKLNRSNINEEQENIDLSSMVVEIKENLISESNISSSAKISIEGDCLELFTNRVIIYTLFGELIKNGLYYNQSDEPKVTIASNLNDDQIEVVFSDNGIGIDKQYHSKIFEMFSRLHNNHDYSGSGIGLAVVKKLVEDFDGDVSVESMKGVGSRFTVLLPKAFWNQGSKI